MFCYNCHIAMDTTLFRMQKDGNYILLNNIIHLKIPLTTGPSRFWTYASSDIRAKACIWLSKI